MFAFGWSSCGRKPKYPEETHLSWLGDHMTISHADPGSILGVCMWDGHVVTKFRCWKTCSLHRVFCTKLFFMTIYKLSVLVGCLCLAGWNSLLVKLSLAQFENSSFFKYLQPLFVIVLYDSQTKSLEHWYERCNGKLLSARAKH